MSVIKGGLNAKVMVCSVGTTTGASVNTLNFFQINVIDIQDRRKTKLMIRRAKHRIAFQIDKFGSQILIEKDLIGGAKNVEAARVSGRRGTNGRRHFAHLYNSVRERIDGKKPLIVIDGSIALQHVSIVGIPPGVLVAH